jgi:uncharacterized protein YwqG
LLERFEQAIKSTLRPSISIIATPNANTRPWQSKFGGLPYLPNDFTYPQDEDGKFLHLLAQINFAECPRIEPFPERGILQFYIGDDDLNGLSFTDPIKQDRFRVLYFKDADASRTQSDFSFLPEAEYFPLAAPYSLKFVQQDMPVTIPDYRFEKSFGTIADLTDDFLDDYHERYPGSGHRIGGYPYFTQQDPRNYRDHVDKDTLLLQIDTDGENEIMWGDSGVGCFLISSDDLRNCNFSNVLYNWDCC